MNVKDVEYILQRFNKESSRYNKRLLLLNQVRYQMQGLNGFDYSKVRVQGGEKRMPLEELYDKEQELKKSLEQAFIDQTTAYDCAIRLIYLLPNANNDCDILCEIYLLRKSYNDTAKKFCYTKETLWNKVSKAKRLLAKITTEQGLSLEDFIA